MKLGKWLGWKLYLEISWGTYSWDQPGVRCYVEAYRGNLEWEAGFELGLGYVEPEAAGNKWGARFFGRIYENPEQGTQWPCGWRLWCFDLMGHAWTERRGDLTPLKED